MYGRRAGIIIKIFTCTDYDTITKCVEAKMRIFEYLDPLSEFGEE
jgi:hypothetical protein